MVKVSVIIPTYKRSEVICRAVDSVLAQTLDSIEVLVVDDNGIGTEHGMKTAEVMDKYRGNGKVRYFQHEENRNGSAARNTGINASRGEYISFLDDDDIYCPERLRKMADKMDSLDSCWGACYTGYVKNMKNGTRQFSAEKNEGDLFKQALMRSLFIGSGSNLFFRRSVIEEIGPFNESFRRNQDLEYLIRVLDKYKMAYVDEVLMETFNDARNTVITNEQSQEREALFRKEFAPYLEKLSDKEKREVLIMYAIDYARTLLQRKEYKKALDVLRNEKVPASVLAKYAGYVLNRVVTKTSYGFMF